MTSAIANAVHFFQQSCGRWRSQRSVHHLLHRRAEAGGSLIVVEDLDPDDSRLKTLAEQHGKSPECIAGGSFVRWSASMAWDQNGDAHDGETIFGLIPDGPEGRSGSLLRDLGYAEKAPATSTFRMDEQDGLILCTSYETMTVWERFWFTSPNVRLRSSTVEGLSNNASFCMETRLSDGEDDFPASSADGNKESKGPVMAPFGW